jgi:cobaltochelatase CobS
MTDYTAIQALQNEIGPRGQTPINSYNRGPVRRWLVQWGVDSPTARTLPNGELDRIYNDASDEALKALLAQSPTTPPASRPASRPVSEPTPDTQEIAVQLAVLLAKIQAGGSLDEDRVREIVQEALETQRPLVIEFRTDNTVRTVEGATHRALPDLTRMLSAGLNVWLVGPAGSGKTTLAEQAAKALGRPFYSTGAVTSDFRLMGFTTATGDLVRTPFREAFEHGGVFLWDEVDGSNPNALVAFNQALANGCFAFPDGMVTKHQDFVAIAAANTWGTGATTEYIGRVRQDAATLDRFVYLPIDYDEALERDLVGAEYASWVRGVQRLRRAAGELGVKALFTPRASINGARLLAAGLRREVVVQTTLRKGLDDATWAKLESKAREYKAQEAD